MTAAIKLIINQLKPHTVISQATSYQSWKVCGTKNPFKIIFNVRSTLFKSFLIICGTYQQKPFRICYSIVNGLCSEGFSAKIMLWMAVGCNIVQVTSFAWPIGTYLLHTAIYPNYSSNWHRLYSIVVYLNIMRTAT